MSITEDCPRYVLQDSGHKMWETHVVPRPLPPKGLGTQLMWDHHHLPKKKQLATCMHCLGNRLHKWVHHSNGDWQSNIFRAAIFCHGPGMYIPGSWHVSSCYSGFEDHWRYKVNFVKLVVAENEPRVSPCLYPVRSDHSVSYDNLTTTSPHNPLYVLHRCWMLQWHTQIELGTSCLVHLN